MDASDFERTTASDFDHSATLRSSSAAALLMCEPAHFGVTYSINPWMDPASWARDDRAHAAARREWTAFHRVLTRLGAAIELIPAVPGLPDLVFTANAALVLDRTALLARFRHPERQAEESHVAAAFRALQARGVVDEVVALPEGVVLEGAGDCVWDAARQIFWMGHGPRSSLGARDPVAEIFGAEVVALELADARFYHMDTALSALPGGEVMYVPCAFTAAGRGAINERVPAAARIAARARLPGRHHLARLVPAQRRLGVLPDVAAGSTVGAQGAAGDGSGVREACDAGCAPPPQAGEGSKRCAP